MAAAGVPDAVNMKKEVVVMDDSKEGMVSGEYVCPVCGYQTNDKHCFHYGGISCYSCRAFFRRAHQVIHGILLRKRDFGY